MSRATQSAGGTVVLIALCLAFSALPLEAQQESWASLGLTNLNTRCAAVAPGNSNLILAGGNNLYVSADGGQTWSTKSQPGSVWSVTFGSNQNVAYAGAWNNGLFKSTDGCLTWVPKDNGLFNTVVKSICVSPTDDNTVYAVTESGLFKSTNAADSWSQIYSGVNGSAVAVAPTNAQVVYFGTWGSGMWKSTDAGSTWNQMTVGTVPAGATCNRLVVDPTDENIVYTVFQGNGAWSSFDGGANWQAISPAFEGFCVTVDKLRPWFVYGLGGWTYPQRSGCYGGTGWNAMTTSYNGSFALGIAVDPNDSSKVYACTPAAILRWIADIQPPNPPGTLSAAPSSNGIALTWSASSSSDCTGYWVYRRDSGGSYGLTPSAVVLGRTTTTFNDIAVIGGSTYYYKVAAVDNAQNHSTFTNEAHATVASSYDLDVTYIARLPRDTYFYWVEYPNGIPIIHPGYENLKRWPAYGEAVTFVAHFINKGTANPGSVNYRWKINGVVAGTGSVAGVGPAQEGTASLNWTWNVNGLDTDHSDQTVTFEIDYDSRITETYETNNSLTDYLEGVCLFFFVEQALYDSMNSRLNLAGTYSFEDWLKKQIDEMNAMFARSTYSPLAPNGALERVRVDKIVVAQDPGYAAQQDTDPRDGTWGLSGGASYASTFALSVDGGLVHELMHQLGIIDLYAMGVGANGNEVITPDGLPNGTTWGWGRPGIMAGGDISPHTTGSYCDQHTTVALNKNCGYRRGYYGEYMFDIPTNNYILVKDAAGNPAPNVTIRVFQIQWDTLPNTPVITGTTDANGKFLLTNRPPYQTITTATGHAEHDSPFGTVDVVGKNANLLIETSRPGGDFDYAWMDITQFNLAYWAGNTSSWTYTINSRLASVALPRITTLNGAVEGTKVTLGWPAVPGASSYRIYRASSYLNQADDPTHQYENWVYKPLGTAAGTAYTDTTIFQTSRYAVAARDGSGKEAPLSSRLFAPMLYNPWAVGVLSDNKRVVLDPQNGYALLRQDPEGRYICNFGSVHYHLEWSYFMAIDRNLGRLIFAHPMDFYSDRHSIRVSDLNAVGILEFGDYGSNPGQFNTPAGVAVDGESRIYVADRGNNRIEVFNSDGSLITTFGSAGSGAGQFNYPQGVAVDSRHRVYVCDKGNARVQILQFNGATLSYLGTLQGKTLSSPVGVAIGPGDNVFVTDYGAGRVEAFSANGNWLRGYTTPTDMYTGTLLNPTGIAVDNNGVLVVCDTGKRRVVTIAATQPSALGDARLLPNGSPVQLEGKIVTAKFSDCFYIEEPDRTAGIRVASTAAVVVGDKVDIYGTVQTTPDPDRERQISVTTLAAVSSGNLCPPLGMNLRTMGGAPVGPVPGIEGASGLNNVGLLILAFGTTSDKNQGASEFYLDDGSGFKVRVYAPGLGLPSNGSKVAVTGISGAAVSSGKNVRVLRARTIRTF